MEKKRILIVDDEKEIAKLVAIHIEQAGYEAILAYNGAEALKIFKTEAIDLIILDIMMPKLNGHEVLKKIRQTHQTPIIFLSAKTSDFDKISGLVIGADDYMTKPFNPMELIARVNVQFRRIGNSTEPDQDYIAIKHLIIRKNERVVTIFDEVVPLTPKEFAILLFLAESPNQVFSSEQIFRHVWEEAYFEGANTVMVHIRTLRKKLQDAKKSSPLIETVWGVGYKIND